MYVGEVVMKDSLVFHQDYKRMGGGDHAQLQDMAYFTFREAA
jgi:hypothetical protein